MKREFAAYPLFVKDPYFSLWANTETVNESAPVFWVGNKKILNGYIIVDALRLFGRRQRQFEANSDTNKGI